MTREERIPVQKAIIEIYKLKQISEDEQKARAYTKKARETGHCSIDTIVNYLISVL